MYFSSRKRSNLTISAPADSAPFEASVIKVSVFHPFLGPAFTTTIFLLIFSSLNQFLLNVPMYAPFTFTLERYFIPGSQSKEIISPE